MATETGGVRRGCVDFALLGLVECEIQVVVDILVVVALLMVNGGGNYAVYDSQDAGDGFYSTGSSQQVTCHRLG